MSWNKVEPMSQRHELIEKRLLPGTIIAKVRRDVFDTVSGSWWAW